MPSEKHKGATPATRQLFDIVHARSVDPAAAKPKILAALDAGADLDFVWEASVSHRQGTTLWSFVEPYHKSKEPMLGLLLDLGANPLIDALRQVVKSQDYFPAARMVDAAARFNHRNPAGLGVFAELLGCKPDVLLPDLLTRAVRKNADTTPPPGKNWAHVLLANPQMFPSTRDPDFSLDESHVSWAVLDLLLDQGADLLQPDADGVTPLALLQARLKRGCPLPGNDVIWAQVEAAQNSHALDQLVPVVSLSNPARRM